LEWADRLRKQPVDTLDDGKRDLLVDRIIMFDDAALAALVSGRSRAKAGQHRIVVLDASDGVLARLTRTGMVYRLPVYPDAAAAEQALSTDRAAAALRSGAFGDHREADPAPAPPAAGGAGTRS